MTTLQKACSSIALLAAAVWLGGLVALGAITAPIVFAVTPWPASADAMTLVFRRFDEVAMTCAALVLGAEALRTAAAAAPGTARALAQVDLLSGLRTAGAVLAAVAAVVEGTVISPRIAALHAAGAVRGVGPAGTELSHLHDWAERLGKGQVVLLALVVALYGLGSMRAGGGEARRARAHGAPRVDDGSAET